VLENFKATANGGEFTFASNTQAKAFAKQMEEFQATNECQALVNAHYAPKAVKTRQKGCVDRNFERAVKAVDNMLATQGTVAKAIKRAAEKYGVDEKALKKAYKG
jgi:hypothetical protein